jgi:hypothetical protein
MRRVALYDNRLLQFGAPFAEAVFGCFFFVEDRPAVSAYRDAVFHLLSASRAIRHSRRHVRPLALDSQRNRCPPMHVGNLAERMPSRPHRVCVENEPMIKVVAPGSSLIQLLRGGTRSSTDEDPVVVEILQKIVRDLACRDREREAAIVAQIESVTSRRNQQQRIGLAFRARRNMINTVSSRDIPVLIGNRRYGNRRCCIVLDLNCWWSSSSSLFTDQRVHVCSFRPNSTFNTTFQDVIDPSVPLSSPPGFMGGQRRATHCSGLPPRPFDSTNSPVANGRRERNELTCWGLQSEAMLILAA